MIRRLMLAISLFTLSSPAFAALTVGYTETVPRNVITNATNFDIEINIRDLVGTKATDPTQFFARLKFFLPKVTASGGEITKVTENYRVEETKTATVEESDATKGNFDGVVYLRVVAGTESIQSLVESDDNGKFIQFRVEYTDGDTTSAKQEFKGETKKLRVLVDVADEKPSFEASGAHKRIKVSFSIPSSIAFTREHNSAPTGISAIAIRLEADGLSLPSYRHEPTAEADVAGKFCTYHMLENGGDCITCGEDGVTDKNYFLNVDELANMTDDVRVTKTSKTNATALSFSGLDPDQKYAVFMMYQPDGVQRSECAVAQPGVNLTLAELNGEPDAGQKDPQCYIATAAYGTPLHYRIDELRWFRDRYLKPNPVGMAYVKFYYWSAPPIANFVAKHPTIQAGIRWVLDPLTNWIQKFRLDQQSQR